MQIYNYYHLDNSFYIHFRNYFEICDVFTPYVIYNSAILSKNFSFSAAVCQLMQTFHVSDRSDSHEKQSTSKECAAVHHKIKKFERIT